MSLLTRSLRRGLAKEEETAKEPTEEARNFKKFYKLFELEIAQHQEEWLKALTNQQRVRIAAPRYSGKTTFIMHYAAWKIGNDRNTRILICSASNETATAMSAYVRKIVESQKFKSAFPDIRPSEKWSDGAWTVKRTALLKDPTCLAVGVQGSIASRRTDITIIDDPVKSSIDIATLKARRAMVTWWHEVLKPCGDTNTKHWIICTRYRQDDIHGTEFTEERHYHCVTQAAIADGKSYWPEKFPLEYLEQIREENPTAFASQFQQDPREDELTIIKTEWLKEGTAPTEFDAITIGVDLAASQKERADYTAMVAIGRETNKYWVIASDRGRWTIHETAARLFSLHEQMESRSRRRTITAVEATAMQAALIIEFRRRAAEAGSNIRIEADRPKGSKEQRLRGIAGLFEAGKVIFDKGTDTKELKAELTGFGTEAHDDLADALEKALRRAFRSTRATSNGQYHA